MKMKVLNYNAVAHNIKREVEDLIGEPVKLNTIVAAIMRFSSEYEKEVIPPPLRVLKDTRLNLTTGISDITVTCPQDRQPELIKNILESVSKSKHPLSIHQFPGSVKIITDTNNSEDIIEKLRGRYGVERRDGCARLSIRMSPEAEHTAGIMAFIAESLYRVGISAVDGFFAYEDIILILKEADASRAFELFRTEISRAAM